VQHLLQGYVRGGVVADIEGLPGTEPMTGIASPDDGIGWVIIVSAAIAFLPATSGMAAPPTRARTTSRRVTSKLGVICERSEAISRRERGLMEIASSLRSSQ
jgi:hypothetical protein